MLLIDGDVRKKKHKVETEKHKPLRRKKKKSQEEEAETWGGRERVEGYFFKK